MQISGQSAIVTGGATSWGAAVAKRLIEHGAKVTIFDLEEDKGEAFARLIGAKFERVDITEVSDVNRGLDSAESAHGSVRILVNCAGVAPVVRVSPVGIQQDEVDLFRHVVETNLVGAYIVLTHFVARLNQREIPGEEKGVIISTTGITAYESRIGRAAYLTSKAAIADLYLELSREFIPSRVRVAPVSAPLCLTPLMSGISPQVRDYLTRQVRQSSCIACHRQFAKIVEAIILNQTMHDSISHIEGPAFLSAH